MKSREATSRDTIPKNSTRHSLKLKLHRIVINRWMYLMLIPGAVFFITFTYVPLYGIQLAFKDYNVRLGIWGSPWVGLYQFKRLFTDPYFLGVLRNTVLISLYKIFWGIPFAPGFAILLSELRSVPFKRFVQTVSYLPHFLSWVVVFGIAFSLLSVEGLVNQMIVSLGGKPLPFLTNPTWFRPLLVTTEIWKSFGWGSIIYLAAIAGIDPEQYQAAMIDGASRLQRIANITIPGIRGALFTILILMIGGILSAGFDQVFNFYNAAVRSTGDILDTYIYRVGIAEGSFEIATAVGLFKSVFGFILIVTANWLCRRYNEVGLY